MSEAPVPSKRRRRPLLALLPLVLFAGLAALFLYQLRSGADPQSLPSVLIGRAAPSTVLPPLEGVERPGIEPVPGRPRLVNVFASWCVPCREEHPLLLALRNDPALRAAGLRIEGINYKDGADKARSFLAQLGNPFDAVGFDPAGTSTIDWGVYGVPETFLVGADGTILWKQTGPLSPDAVETGLKPALLRSIGQS